MISQPMGGLTKDEMLKIRDAAKAALEEQGYEVLDTVFDSFENCDLCDVVFFCDGWQEKRGCRIEHQAASSYGIKTLYEKA